MVRVGFRLVSLFLEVCLKLRRHFIVGLVGGSLGVLSEAWVPVVELVEAVAEADALLHGQVTQIILRAALCEALLVQVLQQCVVLLLLRIIEVLCTQLRLFDFLW